MGAVRDAIEAIDHAFSDRTVMNAITAADRPAAWGEIYIDEDNTAATDITGTTDDDYEPIAGTWLLSGEAVNVEMSTSDATQKLATGGDVANVTSVAMFGMSPGDYVTLTVRNETSAVDVTAVHSNIVLQGTRV